MVIKRNISVYINYVKPRLDGENFTIPELHLDTSDIVTHEFVEKIAAETMREVNKYELPEDYAYEQAVRICMGEFLCSRLEEIRATFPPGARIRLIHMDDMFAPPDGAYGTIEGVDDVCQIHVSWDTGKILALIPGVDQFEIVRGTADKMIE